MICALRRLPTRLPSPSKRPSKRLARRLPKGSPVNKNVFCRKILGAQNEACCLLRLSADVGSGSQILTWAVCRASILQVLRPARTSRLEYRVRSLSTCHVRRLRRALPTRARRVAPRLAAKLLFGQVLIRAGRLGFASQFASQCVLRSLRAAPNTQPKQERAFWRG